MRKRVKQKREPDISLGCNLSLVFGSSLRFRGLCRVFSRGTSIEWSLRAREHASTASFFASKSSDQICLASSEHFRKYNWGTDKHFINFPLILHVGLLGCA